MADKPVGEVVAVDAVLTRVVVAHILGCVRGFAAVLQRCGRGCRGEAGASWRRDDAQPRRCARSQPRRRRHQDHERRRPAFVSFAWYLPTDGVFAVRVNNYDGGAGPNDFYISYLNIQKLS
jgi:hypothetical protein